MTEQRRIVFNIVFTFGRSLISLVCGLFTGRWLLLALGDVDYGLYGVVGGLAGFIAIVNGILGGSIGRFYAFSLGKARINSEVGLEECRGWFNTALSVHLSVSLILTVIGYPLGVWAICSFLKIPLERIDTYIWVWRFVCLSTFIGMVNVTFNALYIAKQYIAELTIYSVFQTIFNVCFLYFMVTHPRDWVTRYALYVCMLQALPQCLIVIRAWVCFPECKLLWREWFNLSKIKQLGAFAGWQAFGGVAGLIRGQCMAILVNKYFDARVNAGMSVANTVNQQTAALSTAMQTAFVPAITTACGEEAYDRMRYMSFRACKFGMLLVLLFSIPLMLEVEEVMRLWLITPPPYATGLCLCMMISLVIDKSSLGHMVAVNAIGKIALYQAVLGGALILTLPIAWGALALGFGPYAIGFSILLTTSVCAFGRVWFARIRAGMSAWFWVKNILLPVLLSTGGAVLIGSLPRIWLDASFMRVCVTTVCCEITFLPLVWWCVLEEAERRFVVERCILRFFNKKV